MKERGQTLIEVLMVLSVATIMVVALIAAVLSSLKSSQFAQNQAKATKYSQDAIDKIKTARDRNINVNFLSTNTPNMPFQSFLSDSTQCPSTVVCYFRLNDSSLELTQDFSSTSATTDVDNGLRRLITITSTASADEKLITVQIFWTDSNGDHSSNIQTILRNYQ